MKKRIFFMIIALLIMFASCKIFEPDIDPSNTTASIKKAKTNDLFDIDDWEIDFVGAAPNYIEGYFEFDQDMDKSSFQNNLYIYPVTAENTLGNRITNITFNWQNARRVEFRTQSVYDDNTDYLIKIASTVKDKNGNGIEGDYTGTTVDDYTSTDWTSYWNTGNGFGYDLTKPIVNGVRAVNVNINRTDGGDFGNVGTGEYFEITFSENIIPADVNSSNISFDPAVVFNVITVTANTLFRVTPNTPLTADKDYVISINMDNIKDLNGNTGSDNRGDRNDNHLRVKFNTFVTHASTLRYGGYVVRQWDREFAFWFNTPSADDDYLDHSTITDKTAFMEDEEYEMWVEDSILDKRTYIVFRGRDIDMEHFNFTYKIADTAGNTLDGNGNSRLEMDYRDDYRVYVNP